MNVGELLDTLEAISTILNNPNLQNTSQKNDDVAKKVKRFHELVEDIRLQQHDNYLPNIKNTEIILEEISTILNALSTECNLNLLKLDFVKDFRPLP